MKKYSFANHNVVPLTRMWFCSPKCSSVYEATMPAQNKTLVVESRYQCYYNSHIKVKIATNATKDVNLTFWKICFLVCLTWCHVVPHLWLCGLIKTLKCWSHFNFFYFSFLQVAWVFKSEIAYLQKLYQEHKQFSVQS